MELVNQLDITNIVMAGGIILLALNSFMLKRRLKKTEQRFSEMLDGLQQSRSDVGALCTGSVGVARRLNRIEGKLRIQNERQDRLEMNEPNHQVYGQAVRMAKKGADLDELVSTCGLSRGEAELIVMLNHDAVQH